MASLGPEAWNPTLTKRAGYGPEESLPNSPGTADVRTDVGRDESAALFVSVREPLGWFDYLLLAGVVVWLAVAWWVIV